ncbi:Cobalamin synthase [Paramagnetospirillum magnetotacticum MS-1]|uniref:Adenosylcobinamide-GDP ribazoletransferase n=1 Tax=Paramagnetospirillum magnetotacticum MS-1 TaxID=272627 RepID=A0A0C2U7B6_PARME|nr:adenosylcobinamide-GDP ribazoletransferase [Paramagnetospirillum magnetotacticum]KIL97362.1 Cobalamin synthase [Paramagnetospirillum magnetotacticum MS-1]
MSKSPFIDEIPPRSWLGDVHLAAVFLTRLPLPDAGMGDLARSMRAFPLIGLGLGLGGGAIAWAAGSVLPPLAAALLCVLSLVLATGALHEDGLADLADGLGARGDRDKRLEVMRDSRTGAFGVLALIFSVGLRTAALAAIPLGWSQCAALVAACSLSRALIPAAMQVMGPARGDGLGAGAGCPDATIAATAAGLGLLACLAGLGLSGTLGALIAALAAGGAVVWTARRALGGYTGDVLGAVQQATEIGILLAAAGMLS